MSMLSFLTPDPQLQVVTRKHTLVFSGRTVAERTTIHVPESRLRNATVIEATLVTRDLPHEVSVYLAGENARLELNQARMLRGLLMENISIRLVGSTTPTEFRLVMNVLYV